MLSVHQLIDHCMAVYETANNNIKVSDALRYRPSHLVIPVVHHKPVVIELQHRAIGTPQFEGLLGVLMVATDLLHSKVVASGCLVALRAGEAPGNT